MLEAVTAFFGAICAGIFITHAIDGYRSRLGRQAPSPLIVWSIKACALDTPGKCRASDRSGALPRLNVRSRATGKRQAERRLSI